MSHYSSSPRTYMKSRSIVIVWTHEAHIINSTIVCCPLHALQKRGWTWLYQVVFAGRVSLFFFFCCFVKTTGAKIKAWKKLIGLVGFVATWNLLVGHLFIYLAGLIFLSKFYNFIYWVIPVQVHVDAYTIEYGKF